MGWENEAVARRRVERRRSGSRNPGRVRAEKVYLRQGTLTGILNRPARTAMRHTFFDLGEGKANSRWKGGYPALKKTKKYALPLAYAL